MDNKELGNLIRVERTRKEYSQDNMAAELGISTGAYSNIERGKTEITVRRLYQIAEILKTNISSFLPDFRANEPMGMYPNFSMMDEIVKELEKLRKEVNELREHQKAYPKLRTRKVK